MIECDKCAIKEAEILIAHQLGEIAYEKGKTSVPAHDANLMTMLEGRKWGNIHLLDAWLAGWHGKNGTCPVSEL